ncbi:hypothetical protein DH26_gp046 [Chloriridovirus anopheles1]|uniref:Uncharacterized protein n=1 Tax=Chloriridovirus anopheles1 TaxID=1465751 RepID=W8R9L4_9VIRU|nr:hypothetical protein DH26_gp046 [Anopheles minimus iridovirus]AHL67541.1 hypothetical protein AMIV_046 [Anopheles minimus iridovirus]
MLFDSLSRLADKRPNLTHDEKVWLITTINNNFSLEGKEKLYSLLIVFNKQQTDIYDPKEPFYDIEKIDPKLQIIWHEFSKMHLKSLQDDKRRKKE